MRHFYTQPLSVRATCRPFPLTLASEGEVVRIAGLPANVKTRERILSLGIDREDAIRMITKQPAGAVLIETKGNRFVLGGGLALQITVIRFEHEQNNS